MEQHAMALVRGVMVFAVEQPYIFGGAVVLGLVALVLGVRKFRNRNKGCCKGSNDSISV